MTSSSRATPLPFGLHAGDAVRIHSGWGALTATFRVIGPGQRPTSVAVTPTNEEARRTNERDIDAWDLSRETPVSRTWLDLWRKRSTSMSPAGRADHVAACRRATEALLAENPQLLVKRETGEGGPPHSWAACYRAGLVEMGAVSSEDLEKAVRTVKDLDVLDHLRRSAGRLAKMSDSQAPWLDDSDRVILRRIAASGQ